MSPTDLSRACRRAYALAPPSAHIDLGRPPRSLSRCPDAELRRRGYGFLGSWPREDAVQIADYLRERRCVVVLKRGRSWHDEGMNRLWAKKREDAVRSEGERDGC